MYSVYNRVNNAYNIIYRYIEYMIDGGVFGVEYNTFELTMNICISN